MVEDSKTEVHSVGTWCSTHHQDPLPVDTEATVKREDVADSLVILLTEVKTVVPHLHTHSVLHRPDIDVDVDSLVHAHKEVDQCNEC